MRRIEHTRAYLQQEPVPVEPGAEHHVCGLTPPPQPPTAFIQSADYEASEDESVMPSLPPLDCQITTLVLDIFPDARLQMLLSGYARISAIPRILAPALHALVGVDARPQALRS